MRDPRGGALGIIGRSARCTPNTCRDNPSLRQRCRSAEGWAVRW